MLPKLILYIYPKLLPSPELLQVLFDFFFLVSFLTLFSSLIILEQEMFLTSPKVLFFKILSEFSFKSCTYQNHILPKNSKKSF